jgi:HEAT repeat protein
MKGFLIKKGMGAMLKNIGHSLLFGLGVVCMCLCSVPLGGIDGWGQQGSAVNVNSRVLQQIARLRDPNPAIRSLAALSLGRIGPDAAAAVPDLIRSLGDQRQDPEVRGSAAYALGEIGPDANTAVPELTRALKDLAPSVRSSAASALGRIGPNAAVSAPDLVQALSDPNQTAEVRASAAYALGQLRKDSTSASAALMRALKDPDKSVRSSAAAALGQIREGDTSTASALIGALKDPDESVLTSATYWLGQSRQETKIVASALVRELEDRDKGANVRSTAAYALGQLRPASKIAVTTLIGALEDSDASVRNSADYALQQLGPESEGMVPILLEALKRTDKFVRGSIAHALGKIGPAAWPATPTLIELLSDEDLNVQSSAAYGLGGIGLEARPAAGALIEMLRVKDAGVRSSAAYALGQIGPEARAATRELMVTLKDTDPNVSGYAALALGQIGEPDPAAVSALIEASRNEDMFVRCSAVYALGRIGKANPSAIDALIESLNYRDPVVGFYAAQSLGQLGPHAKPAISVLIDVLKDPSSSIKVEAAHALGMIGPDAGEALPFLIQALRSDKDLEVRSSAATAIGQIGPKAEVAVLALTDALKDRDVDVRMKTAQILPSFGLEAVPLMIKALKSPDTEFCLSAARVLGQVGADAREAVPALTESFKNKNKAVDVRMACAETLAQIGPDAKSAIPALTEALKDGNGVIRVKAAEALSQLGPEVKTAVPALVGALKDQAQDPNVRRKAAEILGRIGADEKDAIDALSAVLKDGDMELRSSAAWGLAQFGAKAKTSIRPLIEALGDRKGYFNLPRGGIPANIRTGTRDYWRPYGADPAPEANALAKIAVGLQDAQDTDAIEVLQYARDAMKDSPNAGRITEYTGEVMRAVQYLELRKQNEVWRQIRESARIFADNHLWFAVSAIFYVLWIAVSIIIFLVRPYALLRINDVLKQVKLPDRWGGTIFPLRFILIVGFLNYSERVLDSWVRMHISSCRESFARKSTVRDRRVHISVPVVMDETIPDLKAKHLRRTFAKPPGCLLIWGEGGSGKTSLACRIAKWAMEESPNDRLCEHLMLPVLIEYDLDALQNGSNLLDAVAGQIEDLVGEAEPLSVELLEELLRRRRILVIVDHLSEMNEATREQINPERPGFPAKALIVTSRLEENLGGVTRTVLRPLRVKGDQLSSFMQAYLVSCGKRDLFVDSEFFEACKRLSAMVGERDITVLLAKLYADQMITAKEGLSEDKLPDNIPDLMLSYLNELNRAVVDRKLEDRIVHHDVKLLAWECLKPTFRPTAARNDDAMAALGGIDANAHFRYIEDRLRVIETVAPARNRFRFLLDPLAEYLAGLRLVELYGENREAWRRLLDEASSKQGAPEATRGFLLALRDCCIARGNETKIPEFVERELCNSAGIEMDAVERATRGGPAR